MRIDSLGGEPSVYTDCGYCKGRMMKEKLLIPTDIYMTITALLKAYPSLEWGAVFDVVDGKVTNFRVPLQEVTGASVTFKEDLGGNGCIHSHNKMGAFWSGQDDSQFRNITEYSIVVNNNWDYQACRRVKLPCGGFSYIDVELVTEVDVNIEQYKDKIQEKRRVESPILSHGYSSYIYKWKEPETKEKKSEPAKKKSDEDLSDDELGRFWDIEDDRHSGFVGDEEMLASAIDVVDIYCSKCKDKSCDTCKIDSLKMELWRESHYYD